MAEQREWNNLDLQEYITNFKDVDRDSVLKQIVESELLARYLGTTEGRLILNNVVDSIAQCVQKIVALANDTKDRTEEIVTLSRTIAMKREFMYQLATLATTGQVHVEEIKRRKKRVEQ